MTETVDSIDQGPEAPLLKNRYKLGRVLGRGGMCIVYQAWDTKLERNVAVKRLDPSLSEDPRTRARFDREGRALAQLSHPNLVTLIDRGSTDNEEYLVFDYVEGRSLKDMTREGPLPIEDVGNIAGQVAEGLAAAHLQGLVHRDVKPQNILVDRQGHAKVTDFGIALGPDWTRLTRAGSVIGSARYMSPEQVRSGAIDLRSDIYSLGAVIYEMLAGRPPFDGTNMPEIARQHLNNRPPALSELRPDIPPGLEKVVMRCLEKEPADRFSSMDELLGALVGLGLYAPRQVPGVSHHRRLLRKSETDDRRSQNLIGTGDHQRLRARARVRQRRSARNIKLTIGGAVLALLLIIFIVLVATLGGTSAPNMVGLKITQAKQLGIEAGLDVKVTEVLSFDKPDGTVIGQNPAAGAEVEEGSMTVSVARTPVEVKVEQVKDVDPEGDARENRNLLPNLTDHKESTSWTTEYYRSSSFGNLKTGVGLDFELAEAATMIVIKSRVEGWKGQVMLIVSSAPGSSVANLSGAASQVISLKQPITACRLWFTQLAQLTDSRWGVDLTEVTFYK